jgi:hypothetical protein
MQVEVVRRGGLAGVAVRGAVDTTDLPSDAAAGAEIALRALPFGRPPSPPRHPDSFQYEITVVNGSTRRTAVLDEANVPEGLRPLVDAAVARGSLE